MKIDEGQVTQFIEPDEPQDRRGFLRQSLLAAGALGGGLGLGLGAAFLGNAVTTAFADQTTDIQILQTAASIEALVVAVYNKALTLPSTVNGTANAVIANFVTTTIRQHTDHAAAFNAALQILGAKPQMDYDHAAYDAVVTPALPMLKTPSDVVGLALTLEDAAAQSYVTYAGQVQSKAAFNPLATIAPVEAQHVAALRAIKALLDAGADPLIALPPDLMALPAGAGDVAFRDASFYPTKDARPAGEGSVK